MDRTFAKLVVLFALFGASTVLADGSKSATLPETKDVAILERTAPSEQRNLVTVWLKLPKFADRTPLEAAIVVVENGRAVELREMFPTEPKGENLVILGRGCNPASIVAESFVRLRERDLLTGKVEAIDFPLAEAIEIENLKEANAK